MDRTREPLLRLNNYLRVDKNRGALYIISKCVCRKNKHQQHIHHNLHDLPYELLHIIGSHLSNQDICSLSLVCKHLLAIFSSLDPFQSTKLFQARREFLTLLEKDLPDHLRCFTCNKIYKWRDSVSKDPMLCPKRGSIPHLTYAHLDFQHHDRSVEREIIDLAYLRFKHGPKFGVPLSYLLKSLQAEERLDKSFRMPAVSMTSAAWTRERLLIETEIEVRVNVEDKLHPFAQFIQSREPEKWSDEMPSNPPLIHERVSAVTRRLGLNVHENRWGADSLGRNGSHARFYLCEYCQVSVQVSVRNSKGKWRTVALKTAQNMGARLDPWDKRTLIAGLRSSHKELIPDKKYNLLYCHETQPHHGERQRPPFCTEKSTSNKDHEDSSDVALKDSLAIAAWFRRHKFSCRRNIWADKTMKISGFTCGYSRRKYILPWLLWELPIALSWEVPKVFLWEIPKIFVWDWPKDKIKERQSRKATKQVDASEVQPGLAVATTES